MDKKADSTTGFVSIFFMAFTLALVSFSCTGPIIGTLLVQAAGSGSIVAPAIGMLGFALALAIPFSLFAIFPSWLEGMPASGGWLNSVKVVLGFLELALALKFLSVADLAYGWGILDREVFLVLWIVIFVLLGIYLLGKLKLPHDSDLNHVSVLRLFMAIISFSFAVYMVPGLWGAPLKALSGYLPPLSTMDFNASASAATAGPAGTFASYLDRTKIAGGIPKYADFLHIPYGLEGFFDYRQGIEYARAVGKPVMIDFTGHGCVNCREMEAKVWSDPGVRQLLREQYVVIALYVDDKKQLPQEQWVTDSRGRTMKTLGKINATFQIDRFGINAQPYYVLLDPKTEQMLVPPRSYDLDINGFVTFLESGVNAYTPTKPS